MMSHDAGGTVMSLSEDAVTTTLISNWMKHAHAREGNDSFLTG